MLQSTSRLVSQIQQQAHLAEPPTADFIRGLVTQCKALASHYRTTPEVVLERAWWRTLYAAGICLRDALEASRNHRKRLGLSDKEVEQAYYAIIQVAYFFEPGGVAEKVFQEQGWVWSDEEQRQTSW